MLEQCLKSYNPNLAVLYIIKIICIIKLKHEMNCVEKPVKSNLEEFRHLGGGCTGIFSSFARFCVWVSCALQMCQAGYEAQLKNDPS